MTKPLSLTVLALGASSALLALAALAAVAPTPPPLPPTPALAVITPPKPKPVVLLWDYRVDLFDSNIVFVLHSSTDVTLNITNWPVAETVLGSTYFSNNVCVAPQTNGVYIFSVTNSVVAGYRFYFVTASNWWGESDPSNVLALPPLPRSDVNLRAVRGW